MGIFLWALHCTVCRQKLGMHATATYLNIDAFSTQSAHLTSGNPQTLRIRHTSKHCPRLSVDNGVSTTCIHRNGRIARCLCELRPQPGREQFLKAVKGPMDSHGPLVAAVVELNLSFKYGISNARLNTSILALMLLWAIEVG